MRWPGRQTRNDDDNWNNRQRKRSNARNDWCGLRNLKRERQRVWLSLRNDRPVCCATRRPHRQLGDTIIHHGLVTASGGLRIAEIIDLATGSASADIFTGSEKVFHAHLANVQCLEKVHPTALASGLTAPMLRTAN
jgi:hypothetical protein